MSHLFCCCHTQILFQCFPLLLFIKNNKCSRFQFKNRLKQAHSDTRQNWKRRKQKTKNKSTGKCAIGMQLDCFAHCIAVKIVLNVWFSLPPCWNPMNTRETRSLSIHVVVCICIVCFRCVFSYLYVYVRVPSVDIWGTTEKSPTNMWACVCVSLSMWLCWWMLWCVVDRSSSTENCWSKQNSKQRER